MRATPVALAERAAPGPRLSVPGRVSVVTVCFNAMRTISTAFASVESQTYGDVEYIVVDGNSTDGTREAIRNCDRIDLAISMRDDGIADAFNRGVALSTGEYVAFLNADDVWPASHLETAVRTLEAHPSSAFAFGDLVRADEAADKYYVMRGDAEYRTKLMGWPPEFNHPSFLTRRTVFEQVGLFDLSYRICMDLEWLVRLDQAGLHGVKSAGLWVVMRCGGVSDQLGKMFRDVRRILVGAGVARVRVTGLLWRARAKTLTKEGLRRVGAGAFADRIRHALNANFVVSDPHLVEAARAVLRSSLARQRPDRP